MKLCSCASQQSCSYQPHWAWDLKYYLSTAFIFLSWFQVCVTPMNFCKYSDLFEWQFAFLGLARLLLQLCILLIHLLLICFCFLRAPCKYLKDLCHLLPLDCCWFVGQIWAPTKSLMLVLPTWCWTACSVWAQHVRYLHLRKRPLSPHCSTCLWVS